jgi:hypothetical protein
MSKFTAEQVAEQLEDAGADVREYSGRGMYGEECPAFECSTMAEAFQVFVDIAENDPVMAHELARAVKTDSMGMGMIVYFPRITYAKKAA